jgi:hypothetical protein
MFRFRKEDLWAVVVVAVIFGYAFVLYGPHVFMR